LGKKDGAFPRKDFEAQKRVTGGVLVGGDERCWRRESMNQERSMWGVRVRRR